MGLGTVELLMSVEDTFKIAITDEEATSIHTVGDLHALLLKKIKRTPKAVCLSMHAFYLLRRALMECTGIDRKNLRATTPLKDVIPRIGRRAMIQKLGTVMQARMPRFKRPRWVIVVCAMLNLAISSALAWHFQSVILGIVSLSLLAMIFYALTVPLATEMHDVHSLGGLASRIRDLNFSSLNENTQGIHSVDVWETLVGVLIANGIAREEITPHARLIEDLQLD